jgi:hypothetical protein
MYNIIIGGTQALGVGCARAQQNAEKNTSPVDNFTYIESRGAPADHYDLWPIWWSYRLYQFYKICIDKLNGFCFTRVHAENGRFQFLASAAHNTAHYRAYK